jgi:hypothetical protein
MFELVDPLTAHSNAMIEAIAPIPKITANPADRIMKSDGMLFFP